MKNEQRLHHFRSTNCLPPSTACSHRTDEPKHKPRLLTIKIPEVHLRTTFRRRRLYNTLCRPHATGTYYRRVLTILPFPGRSP